MASGSHGKKIQMAGAPNLRPMCDAEPEPRGKHLLLKGLCVNCGGATIYENEAAHPAHRLRVPAEQPS